MSDERDDGGAGRRERIRPSRPDRAPDASPRRERPRRDEEDEPSRPAPRSGGSSKTLWIVLGVVALFGCCCVGAVAPIGYFGYRGFSDARQRQQVTNNYMQIGLAMQNYHDTMGTCPPVAMKTRSGKPGLSWRVAILPYIGHDSLFKQFKLDQPWDHPDNLKLAAKMPDIYAPRKGAGGDKTHIRLLVGPLAVYDPARPQPRRMVEVLDGTSNTFLFVEAEQSVLWIQPEELAFDPKRPLPPLGLPENDYFLACFCDGSIRPIKKNANPENLKKLATAAGGEIANIE